MTDTSVVVKTTCGDVRGHRTDENMIRFFGIPYGGRTSGARRFRPPRPADPWTGVLDASVNGPACPQAAYNSAWHELLREHLGGHDIVPLPDPTNRDESCLVLNVWTPSADGTGRPVMVWLHAGAWAIGAGTSPFYNGGPLASRGDIVFVSPNHRVGPLGYANLAKDGGPDFRHSANVGNLDIVLALEWVRDNIARFGGDPGNVTLIGESGGGRKGAFLLAMPAARDLFHRVVIQSGAQLHAAPPSMSAQAIAKGMAALGLRADQVKELQNVPADELVAVMGNGYSCQPSVDGDVLPQHPLDAIESGAAADVPVIVGTTRDESALIMYRDRRLSALDDDAMLAEARAQLGAAVADRVLPVYQASRPDARAVLIAALTDRDRRIPAIRLAEALSANQRSNVYMYVFSYPEPSEGWAIHAMDLPFTFNILDPGRADYDRARRVAADFSDAWLAFARTGDPNHGGIPRWEPYDTARRATMFFGPRTELVDDPDHSERLAWDGIPASGITTG